MYEITAVLSVMDAYMYSKQGVKKRVDALNLKSYKWVDLEDSEE
jgi:hypothetical protein